MNNIVYLIIMSIAAQNLLSHEQEPYPQHLAKGDNTKCCLLLAAYMTLPQHIIEAKKSPERYSQVFNFFRWKYITPSSDDLKNPESRIKMPEVTRFSNVNDLTVEDRIRIKEGKYRLQQPEENCMNVFLTSHTDPIVEYYNKELDDAFFVKNK